MAVQRMQPGNAHKGELCPVHTHNKVVVKNSTLSMQFRKQLYLTELQAKALKHQAGYYSNLLQTIHKTIPI